MASLVLLVSSLAALALLVIHSISRRGGPVTAAFFIGGAVFGILRGNIVWAVCQYALGAGTGATPYLPQGRLLPHIGHESLQVVIGWLFAGYLAWTLSEFALRRIGWQDRLFPTVALSALFMACIGYCMETTATRIGWWYWDFGTVNPYFGHVPLAGIAAWFSIATDFLFPTLLIACSQYRRSLWRWLTLLVFPLHMGAHALYNVVPWIDNVHVIMALLVVGLALFNRTRLETGRVERPAGRGPGVADFIPAIAVATFLAVILSADLLVIGDADLACTGIPLVIFALLAAPRIPLVLVAACAALGVGAWHWVGFRALYAFGPLVAFGVVLSLQRVKRALMAGVAWMTAALVLAGLFVAVEMKAECRMADYVRLLKEARNAERRGDDGSLARSFRDQALRMEFTDANDLWWTIRHLLAVNSDAPESSLPEVLRRYEAISRIDPRWTGPWLEWAGWLAADNELAGAIEKCRYAVSVEPTVGSHHAVLGYMLLRDGQVDDARKELTEAVDLGDEAAETRINLAVALGVRGGAREARSLLARILAGDPSHPVARLDLDHLDAAPSRLRADLVHIAAPAMYDFLGFLMFTRADRSQHDGDIPSALRWAEAAAHYVPRSAEFRTNLCVFLAGTGMLEDAVDQCELAAGLDGSQGSARRNLVALCLSLAEQQTGSGRNDAARSTLLRALPFASDGAQTEIRRRLSELPDSPGSAGGR